IRELYPLFRLAAKKQKILMPAWMYRFHPQWQKLKEILSQNLIGKIQFIDIFISYEAKEKNNIRYKKSLGGGVLNDIGCYALSALSLLFEDFPLSLTRTSHLDKKTNVDILTTGVFFYPNFQATFTVCMEMYRYQRLRIFGSHGMIDLKYPFNSPQDNDTHFFLFSSEGEKPFLFPLSIHTSKSGKFLFRA
ncbi:MAG: Gfo/Idh/MocA family protein, partial [Brevinematales bacterium]